MFSVDDLIKNATNQTQKIKSPNKYDENLQVFPINDKQHLNNHLNYLFRTDAGQKWTNELTNGNAYIIKEPYSDKIEILFADTIDGRRAFKALVQSRIKWRAEDKGKTVDEFISELCQTRVDYKDNTVFSFTDRVEADTLDLLNDVAESTKGFDLICLVVHTDQKENYVHTHMLFCME